MLTLQHYKESADGLVTRLTKPMASFGKQHYSVNKQEFVDQGWVIKKKDLKLGDITAKGQFKGRCCIMKQYLYSWEVFELVLVVLEIPITGLVVRDVPLLARKELYVHVLLCCKQKYIWLQTGLPTTQNGDQHGWLWHYIVTKLMQDHCLKCYEIVFGNGLICFLM